MTWLTEGAGIAAAVLSSIFVLPQAVRAVRHGSAGVATTTFQLLLALGLVWSVYGFVEGLPALLYGNLPVIAGALVVLAMCRRDGAPWSDLVPVSLGCVAVGIIVWFALGPEQIGWIAAAIGVSMRVPQLRAVRTAPSIEGVSAATWWIGIAGNICWTTYGLSHGDYRIAVACVIQIVLAGTLLRSLAIRRQAEALAASAAGDATRLEPKNPKGWS